MLDIPCGDFYWMQQVDLDGVDYVGADIVADLVKQNALRHQRPNVHFRQLNLLTDKLPQADLVFCRDCLVHLSSRHVSRALRNICDSGSAYLMTTIFTGVQHNSDIATGEWRKLNFELPPFSFPPPLLVINEQCTEEEGIYPDKSLGLWRIADIRACLA
jgi:hypothetical protein